MLSLAGGAGIVLYGAGPRSILEANAHNADENLRLNDLRRAVGMRRTLTVLLLEVAGAAVGPPARRDIATWEDALAALADPYLAVEALPGASP